MVANVQPITPQEDIVAHLSRLCEGFFFDHIESELTKVVRAMRRTGKAGSLSVTMKMTPKGEQIIVKTTVAGKPPRADDIGNIFYTTDEGELRVSSPNQLDAFGD